MLLSSCILTFLDCLLSCIMYFSSIYLHIHTLIEQIRAGITQISDGHEKIRLKIKYVVERL